MELRRKTELKNVIVQEDQRRTRKKENCENLVLNHLQKNSKWVIIAVIFDLIQYNICWFIAIQVFRKETIEPDNPCTFDAV